MEHEQDGLSLLNNLDGPTPMLRRELAFRPRIFAGKQYYVVEDPVNDRFFRVGLAEYCFLSRLDGRRTVGEALDETRSARSDCGFTPGDALSMCRWVVQSGLAQDKSLGAGAAGPPPDVPAVATLRRGGRITPLSIQIPLFHPDRFFHLLAFWFSWLFSPWALLSWLALSGWAIRDLVVYPDRLSSATSGILAADNWIWLGIVWVSLKIIHECGHGIACKRFGGEIREAGVIFVLLAPLAYVDVTSSWRLRSKWARMAVAAGGMYLELTLAALATLVWARVDPGRLSQVCVNVMMTSGVVTVLFNANPLMRFDGYYLLSDVLELPNLYTSGRLHFRHLVRKYLFGMQSVSPAGGGLRGLVTRIYGILSWGWRNLVFFGLVLTAATLLEGAGIVISVVAMAFWTAALVRRAVQFLGDPSAGGPNWWHFAVAGGGMSGLVLLALTCIPWPGSVAAPAIVRYRPETTIRAEADGFIRKVHVHGGARVEEGQVLVQMFNDELRHELDLLELEIQKSRVQRRIQMRQGELAKAQAEARHLDRLETELREKREDYEHLTLRAPCAGEVVGRNLDALEGTYQPKGNYLLSIGQPDAKEVRLSIAQHDVLGFRHHTGLPTRVYVPGHHAFPAMLKRVEPRASLSPLDLSLSAPYGGALPVRKVDRNGHDHRSEGLTHELLSPRFTATVGLTPDQSRLVHAGQRARVALRPRKTVGQHLLHVLKEWADRKLQRRISVDRPRTRASISSVCRAGEAFPVPCPPAYPLVLAARNPSSDGPNCRANRDTLRSG